MNSSDLVLATIFMNLADLLLVMKVSLSSVQETLPNFLCKQLLYMF